MDKANRKEITWRAAEYEYIPKDVGWYWVIGGVAAIFVGLALWQKNFTFALFIALAATTVIFFGKRRPQILEFKINEKGVGIGSKIFYEFERLENFSIRSRPRHLDEIVLNKKTLVNPYIRVPIDSKSAMEAKAILQKNLPEVEYQESTIDALSEWLGF